MRRTAKIAQSTIVDDGSKQGTQMGPLQNKMQFEKVIEGLKAFTQMRIINVAK